MAQRKRLRQEQAYYKKNSTTDDIERDDKDQVKIARKSESILAKQRESAQNYSKELEELHKKS